MCIQTVLFLLLFLQTLSANTNNHILVIAPPLLSHIIPSLELAKQLSDFSYVTFLISTNKIHELERKGLLNTLNNQLEIIGLNDGNEEYLDYQFEDNQISLTHPIHTSPTNEQTARFHSVFNRMSTALEQLFSSNASTCSLKSFDSQTPLTTRPIYRSINMIIVRSVTPLPTVRSSIPVYLFLPSNLRGVVNYLHTSLNETKTYLDYLWKNIHRSSGFICNSLKEFDENYIDDFYRLIGNKQFPIHFIGPLIFNQTNSIENQQQVHPIIQWLDTQPPSSVIYVAFGSVVRLPRSAIEMLLRALSSYSFIWSLKTNETSHQSTYHLDTQRQFILEWAPQREILSHRSIAFFFSHGGWNSLLEGMIFGKPILVWPFFGDQFVNAKQIVDHGFARQISANPQIDIEHMLTNSTYNHQAKLIQKLLLHTRHHLIKNEFIKIISEQNANHHIEL